MPLQLGDDGEWLKLPAAVSVSTYHALLLAILTYAQHMLFGDINFPVVCESHGGVHPSLPLQLGEWSKLPAVSVSTPSGNASSTNEILSVWRMRLSVGLFHARVGYTAAALRSLVGVPARSSTVAYRISHPDPLSLEFGRLV